MINYVTLPTRYFKDARWDIIKHAIEVLANRLNQEFFSDYALNTLAEAFKDHGLHYTRDGSDGSKFDIKSNKTTIFYNDFKDCFSIGEECQTNTFPDTQIKKSAPLNI